MVEEHQVAAVKEPGEVPGPRRVGGLVGDEDLDAQPGDHAIRYTANRSAAWAPIAAPAASPSAAIFSRLRGCGASRSWLT